MVSLECMDTVMNCVVSLCRTCSKNKTEALFVVGFSFIFRSSSF